MRKKISYRLSFLLVIIISVSCSKNEEIKRMSTDEITNFLLVNEQLPIKTLSNALEWPEEIITGVDLGLIKLNEDGEERLNDIFEDYSANGKNDFIKNNSKKEWSGFIKANWIKSVTTEISKSKLNDIKKREFKNNSIIQNKLNNFIPNYIEKQTKELSRYQFSFFSIRFWKNLSQISWMHIKSTFSKISKRDISYLKPNYIKQLQLEWQNKFNLYFSPNTTKIEMEKLLSNYQNLIVINHKYLSKLSKIKCEQNSIYSLKIQNLKNNSVIDVNPIVTQFNLTMIDNFGLLFIELFIGLVIATIINFFIQKITKEQNEKSNNIIKTFFSTGTSPFKVLIGGAAYLGNMFVSNRERRKYESTQTIINRVIGVMLIVFSFWFISKKQNKIEEEINDEFKTNFSSYFDKTSIQVLDNLNFNSELFFI